MPIEKTITLYHFDELSDEAKEKAREWWRTTDNDFDYDYVYDDVLQVAEILGIDIDLEDGKRTRPKIYWSGFSSQGDGAMFVGDYAYAKGAPKKIRQYAPEDEKLHRIADQLQKVQSKHFYSLAARVIHHGHYHHERSNIITVEDERDTWRDIGDSEETVAELLRDFMRWIYRQLEAAYEANMSDENVDECLRINEYTFTEEGKRAD